MKNKDGFGIFLQRQIPTLVVLVIAIIGLLLVPSQIPLSKVAQGSQLGPRFVPTVMLAAAAIFCVLSIIAEAYSWLAKGKSLQPCPLASLQQYSKVALMVAALLVWYVLLKSVGFIIMTTLLMVVSMHLLGNRRLWQFVVIPVVFSTAIYLLFSGLLNVPLPAGIIPL